MPDANPVVPVSNGFVNRAQEQLSQGCVRFSFHYVERIIKFSGSCPGTALP